MRPRLVLAAALVVATAACGTGDPEAQPNETVTVVETVTVAPEPASPSPTGSPTDGGPQAGDPCEALEPIGAMLAFIVVSEPTPGTGFASGDTVAGCGNTFEAAYQWELLDAMGDQLADGFGTMTCGSGCHGEFSFEVQYTVGDQQIGTLRVFEVSAQDGSETNVNAIPVLLEP